VKSRISIISTAVAMIFGVVTLYYYFFPTPENEIIRSVFLQWAITLAAVALLVGVMNLLSVHYDKLNNDQTGSWFYSLMLIISMLGTFVLVFVWGPDSQWARLVFNSIQVPIEASLMAVLAISLAYASVRLLRRRPTLLSVIFVTTVLLILAGTSPYVTENIPVLGSLLRDLRAWIAQVPAAAGARGILLGVALGTIATGLRIIMGADRPYGD